MITGAHSILYSAKADADRAFFRDVLGFPHVDAGDGWLIFSLPPSEVAVHPDQSGGRHELYLICDDAEAFVAAMQARNVPVSPVADRGWGRLTELTLPGGGKVGVYEPRHPRPKPQTVAKKRAARGKPAKKTAPKRPKRAASKRPKRAATRSRGR
jgi:catechol 2,3-dioxygenase-like lactoylglutathione lyase family enzyme